MFFSTHSLECTNLLICVGNAANAFVEVFINIDDYNQIASINPSKTSTDNTTSQKTKKKNSSSCHIYKSSNTLVCQIKYHIEPKDFFNFTTSVRWYKLFYSFWFIILLPVDKTRQYETHKNLIEVGKIVCAIFFQLSFDTLIFFIPNFFLSNNPNFFFQIIPIFSFK